jgi:hypothetical protein
MPSPTHAQPLPQYEEYQVVAKAPTDSRPISPEGPPARQSS